MIRRLGTQVMAHRGASRAERENTVAALRRAGELGAHAVEIDVRRTADGALVLHHDAHLPDGRAVVDTMLGDLPNDVPTLSDALDSCGDMWVNVEIKNSPGDPDHDREEVVAAKVVELLRARTEAGEPVDRWLVSSFRIETVDRVHQLWSELATAWLTVGVPPDAVELLVGRGHQALHPWEGAVTPELVARCHSAGLAVNVWTCDDPARMRDLVAWEVDGICTNVPDVALAVLAERAM